MKLWGVTMLDLSERRRKIRERVTLIDTDGLFDYEVLEALLTYCRSVENPKKLSVDLIRHFRNIDSIAYASLAELAKISGLDQDSALFLYYVSIAAKHAVIEREQRYHVTSPEKAAAIIAPYYNNLETEVAIGLYLSDDLHFIALKPMGEGTTTSTDVDYYGLLSQAVNLSCRTLILSHNHPFGTASASPEDTLATHQLLQTCRDLGIVLLDHIIVCKDEYCSLAQAGFFDKETEAIRKTYLLNNKEGQ